jgi:hypothetical protein
MVAPCSACGVPRDDEPMRCKICGAPVCDDCHIVCAHHGCEADVCFGCADVNRTFCVRCTPYACPHCNDLTDEINWCNLWCTRHGCARCVFIRACALCRTPTCTDCGNMSTMYGENSWLCSGCMLPDTIYVDIGSDDNSDSDSGNSSSSISSDSSNDVTDPVDYSDTDTDSLLPSIPSTP